MGFRAVALVDLKAVAGIGFGHFFHIIVTGDLGQDGCGRNIRAAAVPFHHGLYIYTKILLSIAVDQCKIRFDFQLSQGTLHGQEGCLEDIDPVDLFVGGKGNAVSQCVFLDDRKQLTAPLIGKLLTIVQTRDHQTSRQDHCGSANRTGQRAAARFVHTANDLYTIFKVGIFNLPHILKISH